MSEKKHTPGPWRRYLNHGAYVKDPQFAELGIEQSEGANMTVALIVTDVPELQEAAEANADLIAAGPELLEAAKAALKCAELGNRLSGIESGMLEDAIAKATGERP